MTEPKLAGGQPVTVVRDRALRTAGVRWSGVLAYDWGFEEQGQHNVQRSFVPLDDGVQINQPVLFPQDQQGWWYCDLVAVVDDGDSLRVDDMWIDVIVIRSAWRTWRRSVDMDQARTDREWRSAWPTKGPTGCSMSMHGTDSTGPPGTPPAVSRFLISTQWPDLPQ